MQRTAVLLVCAVLWNPQSAWATACETIGDVVGGFAGGASSYGLIRSLGSAGSWVTAGLYGAGIAVASTVGDEAAQGFCEDFERIVERTALIYCAAGQYVCERIGDATVSLVRDFQLCPHCHVDEVFGAYFMEDSSREQYLRQIQQRRGGPWAYQLSVLPRNQLGKVSPSVVNAYFSGIQAGYKLQTSTQLRLVTR